MIISKNNSWQLASAIIIRLNLHEMQAQLPLPTRLQLNLRSVHRNKHTRCLRSFRFFSLEAHILSMRGVTVVRAEIILLFSPTRHSFNLHDPETTVRLICISCWPLPQQIYSIQCHVLNIADWITNCLCPRDFYFDMRSMPHKYWIRVMLV